MNSPTLTLGEWRRLTADLPDDTEIYVDYGDLDCLRRTCERSRCFCEATRVRSERKVSKVYLIDVAEGRATMKEYAASRTDLSEEQRSAALQHFSKLANLLATREVRSER